MTTDRLAQSFRTGRAWAGRRMLPTSMAVTGAGAVALAPEWWWARVLAAGSVVTWGRFPLLLIAAGVAGIGLWALRRWRAGGRSRRQPVAERIPLYVHVAVLLMLAVAVAAIAGFGVWALVDQSDVVHGAEWTVQNTFDAMKIVLSIVAGIGGVVALTVAYRKQDHGEAAEHRENTKLFNERFGKAAEQLGSDKAAVRLAGVYAMGGLADDWVEGRQTCIDVLCAYLRMPYASPADTSADSGGSPTADSARRAAREEQQVRQTVISLIRYHLLPPAKDPRARPRWHGHHFNLRAAAFDGGGLRGIDVPIGTSLDFSGATFASGEVSLAGAEFSGGNVTFAHATFSGGTVDFAYATVSGGTVNFYEATLSGGTIDFSGAALTGGEVSFDHVAFSGGTIQFFGATFSGGEASFGGARFSGTTVDFRAVSFSGGDLDFGSATVAGGEVGFTAARFSGGNVIFGGTTFSGGEVHFRAATFSGALVDFRAAAFGGGTVDFSYPSGWAAPPVNVSASDQGVKWPTNADPAGI